MCGILGYIGKEHAYDFLVHGLQQLEYRGYDSWGVTLLKDTHLSTFKHTGKVQKDLDTAEHAMIGIGHTRWATHGGISEQNAHPHMSEDGRFSLVHNGIIENADILKESLLQKGHIFVSQTDSECAVHLLEEYLKEGQSFADAFRNVFSKLEGYNALLVLDSQTETMYACKNLSSLFIGIGEGERIITSDEIVYSDRIKEHFFLQDNVVLTLSESTLSCVSLETGAPMAIDLQSFIIDKENTGKGSFSTYFLKEVYEEASCLEAFINDKHNREKLLVCREAVKKGNIVFTGCGSAFYTCLVGKALLQKQGIKVDAIPAGEFLEYMPFINKDTLLFALSQSGETADLLEFVRKAKGNGSKIVAITNHIHSNLAMQSDVVINLHCGTERSVASTKAVMNMIAAFESLSSENAEVLLHQTAALMHVFMEKKPLAEKLQKLALELEHTEHIYIIGKGLYYPLSLEAALKAKETSYFHAEAFAASELKHGPLALIKQGSKCIVFLDKEYGHADTLSSIHELKARGAEIIGIGNIDCDMFDISLINPANSYFSNFYLSLLTVQLLCSETAAIRRVDIDKPRNLAKSVTVK